MSILYIDNMNTELHITISNSDNRPIYEQIHKQIQLQIVEESLQPGQLLPSIRQLAADLHISVITTKRAYDELERDGFINSIPGKGSFVADQNPQLLREQKMKMVEDRLRSAVEEAQLLGISSSDVRAMLDILMGGDNERT